MCIQQVQAWQHGSALFNSEVEAVEAALKEYAQKLMREHSSDPFAGLVGMTDKLVPLLQRYDVLMNQSPHVVAAPLHGLVHAA